MNVLILGGTQFIGKALVEQLMQLQHINVTLYNRGKTNKGLFGDLSHITGDRMQEELPDFGSAYYDCVVDLSCYYPHSMHYSLEALKGQAERYIFVSTVSVYPFAQQLGKTWTETDATATCSAAQAKDHSPATYGARKAESERVLQAANWVDSLILRPSIVLGPHDPTARLYYWAYRMARTFAFILPDGGKEMAQFVYLYDLVNTIIKAMFLSDHAGVYNVAYPEASPFSQWINALEQVLQRQPRRIDVPFSLLTENGLMPGADFPLLQGQDLLLFDTQRLQQDFEPTFTLPQVAIQQTLPYYKKVLDWQEGSTGLPYANEQEILQQAGLV